jgi:hypothetical protein
MIEGGQRTSSMRWATCLGGVCWQAIKLKYFVCVQNNMLQKILAFLIDVRHVSALL